MPGIAGQKSGGRGRKSAQQHRLQGTFRKHRHGGDTAPEPPAGIPVPPEPLEGRAAAEWARMMERLTSMGCLAKVDDGVIFQYCRLYAETEQIAVTQAETAATIVLLEQNLSGPAEEREDLLQVAQEITKLRQLEARYTNQVRQGRMAIRQYLVEFGLTPAARSRVKLPVKDEAGDPFAQFDEPTDLQ